MLAYPTMTVAQITALPVAALAASDAHLFLWTTQRYLPAALDVVRAWGFSYRSTLPWAKRPRGFALGGTFGISTEFVIFARRGRSIATSRTSRDWWSWPRGEHSRKPDEFFQVVEATSPGPYLELFARRPRAGWDVWGDEVDCDVELAAVA